MTRSGRGAPLRRVEDAGTLFDRRGSAVRVLSSRDRDRAADSEPAEAVKRRISEKEIRGFAAVSYEHGLERGQASARACR